MAFGAAVPPSEAFKELITVRYVRTIVIWSFLGAHNPSYFTSCQDLGAFLELIGVHNHSYFTYDRGPGACWEFISNRISRMILLLERFWSSWELIIICILRMIVILVYWGGFLMRVSSFLAPRHVQYSLQQQAKQHNTA